MKFLIVDDDPGIVEEVGDSLRRRGHTTVQADGVEAALAALRNEGPFDVVLTDIRMNTGSGFDVIRACAGDAVGAPAMLMMSGHAGAAEVNRAERLGVLHVLKKPFSRRELMDAAAAASARLRASVAAYVAGMAPATSWR
jgi:DNA-binding NtrC family response regulator